MIITARRGGTAFSFWLSRSAGNHFDTPTLWLQTNQTFKPELAQQYVAADFTGEGRNDVLIAQKRADSGLDLWVAASAKTGAVVPALWAQAKTLS